MYVPPLFKKKWFWITVVVVFILALIWDISLAGFILFHSLTSGKWSTLLLSLGLLYTVSVVYRKFLPATEKRKTKIVGRLILLVIAIIAFTDHGFFQALYFLATVFIFSRFTNWIISIITRKRKKHYRYAASDSL